MQILLKENSKNTVSDKRSTKEESDSTESEENSEKTTDYDAAIYSEGDLLLSGSGSLTVEGGYEDGIHSKASLTVESGDYKITASHHGLNGKKTLTVKDGTFDITTVEDALHSKSDVSVENGKITVNAGDDGLHSACPYPDCFYYKGIKKGAKKEGRKCLQQKAKYSVFFAAA